MVNKYQKKANEYLLWGTDSLRPSFTYQADAPTALQAMKDWESLGTRLPACSCEPELLADYVAGKRSRDWHITQWRSGIKEGLFFPNQFIGELG